MSIRLIVAIVASLLDEAILVAFLLWWLPQLGIIMPLPWIIVILAAVVAWAVISFRLGSQALRKKPLIGFSSMVGIDGRVVRTLAPEGFVRIRGELWQAKTDAGEIPAGAMVRVVRQQRLKLIVHDVSKEMSGEKGLEVRTVSRW